MRILLRRLLALLLAPESYLRLVFVLLGAAIALALGIADFTLLALIAATGTPPWAVMLVGIPLVGGPPMLGLLPAMRQVEGVAVQALLVVRFHDGPPGPAHGWAQRGRTLGWFLLHLAAGAVLVAAVLAVIGLRGSIWVVPAAAATVLGTLLLGRLLALIGPVWLGPSYAERLERLHADAARAIERNRLAREIHDSVGHALSLVTLQASAARRLLDRDPAFADEALRTIETTSRRAVADLDHLLGLLRDERRSAAETGPALDADTLDDLLRAAGAAGLSVGPVVSGDLSQLPVLVAREAYRIVQEGLTNALKYSADRTAGLAVSLDDGALEILLTNPTDEERAIRAGRGLRGIRERAAMLGGRSSVGRGDDGWTLSVVLPAVAP